MMSYDEVRFVNVTECSACKLDHNNQPVTPDIVDYFWVFKCPTNDIPVYVSFTQPS